MPPRRVGVGLGPGGSSGGEADSAGVYKGANGMDIDASETTPSPTMAMIDRIAQILFRPSLGFYEVAHSTRCVYMYIVISIIDS